MNRHYGAIFIAAAIFAGRLAAVSHTIRRSRALFSKLVWRRFSGFRRPRGVRKCNERGIASAAGVSICPAPGAASGSLQDIDELFGKPFLRNALQVVSRMT